MAREVTVLLVDDETLDLEMLKRTIPWSDLGLRIALTAHSAREALMGLERCAEPIDLLVSDIQMPIVDGLTLFEQLKARCPGIHALFISGHEKFEFVRRALQLGASGYILKPIDNQELARELCALRDKVLAQPESRADQDRQGEDALVGAVHRYVDQHLEGGLDVGQVADQFGYSANYLSSVFRQKTGGGLGAYIQRRRLERARELLSQTQLTVGGVSQRLGYATPSHFVKVFRESYRMTPGEYRRQERFTHNSDKFV